MPHPKLFEHAVLCIALLVLLVGCSPAAETGGAAAFDGGRAYDLLNQQVSLGPRVPGTSAHTNAVKLMERALKPRADLVSVDRFSEVADGKPVDLSNILARFDGKSDKWVLLAAHWDSRPRAEYEVDAAKRKQPIPGANDGASGVAVLLELARVFSEKKPDVGVLMVFFDGEDYGQTESGMYLGARHFAANLGKLPALLQKPIKIDYGILLDMVGDKDLHIYQEQNSLHAAPEVVRKVWSAARKLGYEDQFVPKPKFRIDDDHIPLIKAGVKCIDIIDFDYGPWHTLDDTPDKCSAGSLKTVGDVVARLIYEEKP
jgi:hypothetical protein